jgi:hypothetical protein
MTGLTGWIRGLVAVAVLTLPATGALAQLKAWPDQQPQQQPQQAWPGDNRPAASGAAQPMAAAPPPMNAAPPPGMGGGGFGGGMSGPPRENPCMGEFTKLRGEVERAGKVAKSVNDRKGTREEFCKAITGLHNAQSKWVKYAGDNAKNCGIPPDVIGQLKAGAANLGKMKTNICNGGGGPGGGGPAAAPSLSEALGTARLPSNDDAPKRRGGVLDTLTGEQIR